MLPVRDGAVRSPLGRSHGARDTGLARAPDLEAGAAVALLALVLTPPAILLPAPAGKGGTGAEPYADGPPPGHTGGFGEPTCHRCHFDGEVDAPGGELRIEGVPERYASGRRYELIVVLERDSGMARAGFQLAARRAAGERAGLPAGALEAVDPCVQVVAGEGPEVPKVGREAGLRYASHTETGSRVEGEGRARWRVLWRAPADSTGVVFHAAANAANGDASEFGDRVYTARVLTRGGGTSARARTEGDDGADRGDGPSRGGADRSRSSSGESGTRGCPSGVDRGGRSSARRPRPPGSASVRARARGRPAPYTTRSRSPQKAAPKLRSPKPPAKRISSMRIAPISITQRWASKGGRGGPIDGRVPAPPPTAR